MSLTSAYLKDRFDYDAASGNLIWRKARNLFVGRVAGSHFMRGYLRIALDGRGYMAHRLVWLWHGGELKAEIDHIDGDRTNNRIENLRLADRSQNTQNAVVRKDNKTGVKGVSWHKASGKWMVSISANKKRIHLGLHDDLENAKKLAAKARIELHGAYARHQ